MCKRVQPDIQTATAVLCSRVKGQGKNDWKKLTKMMKFLHVIKEDLLALRIGKGHNHIKWFVDATFGVHPDYKGHMGAAMKFKDRKGYPLQKSSN